MKWEQLEIVIESKGRGFHLITDSIITQMPIIKEYNVGMLNVFLLHTSASLTINENSDSSVRDDLEKHFNFSVPEHQPYYKHTFEGPDDMPAHIKSSIIGSSINIPIKSGNLALGKWQGIYLCEHRNASQIRKIVLTVYGEK